MLNLIILVNLLLGVSIAARMYFRQSPFYIMFLSLCGLIVFPSFFEPLDQLVDFHAFATPIVTDYNLLMRAQSIVFVVFSIFSILEFFSTRKITANVIGWSPGFEIFIPLSIMLVFCYIISRFGLATLLSLDFGALRDGTVGSSALLISYLSILSAPLVSIYYYNKNYLRAAFVLLLIIATSLIVGGSRQPIVLSGLLLLTLHPNKNHKKFFIITILIVFLLPAFDYFLTILKIVRNLPSFGERLSYIASLGSGIDYTATSEGVLRYVYYSILHTDGIGSGGGEFMYMKRVAFFWLPSSLDFFSFKPEDFEYLVFAAIMGNREGSMHPTFFGMIYADALHWYAIWVLFAYSIIWLSEHVVQKSSKSVSIYLWSMLVYVSIMWARGSIYGPMVVFFVATIVTFILTIINGVRENRVAPDRSSINSVWISN